jgi:hypothetical protein
MPVVFLYRHAIETLMKAILMGFGPGVGVCPRCVLRRSHNLKRQLPDLKAVAELSGVSLSSDAEALLRLWDKDDAQGMKARYPLTIDGERDCIPNHDAFDLAAFVTVCESLLSELEAILRNLQDAQYHNILRAEGITE